MQDLPIRNIFLPAALVSALSFSALTFVVPPLLSQFFQPQANDGFSRDQFRQVPLDSVHKEIAISYIGTVMILSTGMGITTAEILRRRYQKSEDTPDLKSVLTDFIDNNSYQETDEMDTQFSEILADLPQAVPAWSDEIQTVDDATADVTNDSYQFSTEMPEASWPVPSDDLEEDADSTVMIFPGQYQRCRIQLPGQQEQHYAISFDEQFYSLLSAGVSKEQALTEVKHLAEEDRAAILTTMNQGYAIWVLEPEARLVSVA